jgi:CRISPR-associated protein Cas1
VLYLDHLLIGSRGISFSTDAIDLCCSRGIEITIVDQRGKPTGKFSSPALHGSCRTRRAQIASYDDARGAGFAQSIIAGKLLNQAANLKYFAKNRRKEKPELHKLLNEAADCIEAFASRVRRPNYRTSDAARLAIMSTEAEAARVYWSGIAALFGGKTGFRIREQRGTRCRVNAALNYAYGVFAAEVWTAVLVAGLEPYAGLLHADRPGRSSFVLDMIEEFRPAVDRCVFGMAAKGWKIALNENGWLVWESKRKLLDSLGERLETAEPYHGRRTKLRNIIQAQASAASRHFLEKEKYAPYKLRW